MTGAQKALLYGLLVAFALLFVGPFALLLSTALKTYGQPVYSFPPQLVPWPPTLRVLIDAWTAIPFPRYLLNSFLLVTVTVPLHVLVCALAGYPLARMRFPGRQLVFAAILSTLFLPAEVMLVPRFLVVSELNLVDSYAGVVMPALVGAFGVFLLRQAFAAIPRELEEAARVDGCGELRLWWSIMVPQVRPALATVAIFSFISVWNDFVWPLVVLSDPDKFPIALGLAYLAGIFGADVRSLAAGTVIAMLPVMAFFLALQRHFVAGLQGAVKE